MAAGGTIAAIGLASVGLDVSWQAQMASMVVLGFGFFLLHNSVQTEVTELAPSARASSFSLHAFSFFMGQAVGPRGRSGSMVGFTLWLARKPPFCFRPDLLLSVLQSFLLASFGRGP